MRSRGSRIISALAVSRFARTLSTLLASGIGLLPALDIVKSIVDNTVLTRAIERARDAIREGQSIAPPLRESGLFPPLVVHMVAVGERSGELETMLGKAADAYDDEVENAVVSLTTILEPIIIVFMGGVVLFIVLAILLPIFELNRIVRGTGEDLHEVFDIDRDDLDRLLERVELKALARTGGTVASSAIMSRDVLRATPEGSIVRLKDVARIELGTADYDVIGRFNGKPTAVLALYQLPGSNAIDISNRVRATKSSR